ncbi:Non-structural protein NSP1 like [uncultured Mediterranean phage uvMED]|nr:Non-structural protein NSP1 like [uncultured Mediterranean phage uvMED]
MSDNQANPVEGAETDLQNAAKSIEGLLTPSQEPLNKEQVSSEPKKEELSQDNQPQEQEKMETETEAPAEEEVSEEVSQDENAESQIQEQDSTYKVKVAGQEFDVTLDELRAGYSRDADYRRKTEELANDRKSLQSETEQQRQDYSQRLSELNQLVSLTQEQLNSEFKNLDLEKLYEEDPTEAARLEHKMRKKQEKLAESIQKVKAEQQKQFQQVVSDQQKILVNKLPEFADTNKATKLKTDMRSYLQSYGFKDQEIGNIYDHRIVMLVNDAMKYRSMQKLKPNLASKMAKPGKVLSSGVKKTKADANFAQKREKLGRLKKSGSIKDAQSIFLDMITKNKK